MRSRSFPDYYSHHLNTHHGKTKELFMAGGRGGVIKKKNYFLYSLNLELRVHCFTVLFVFLL